MAVGEKYRPAVRPSTPGDAIAARRRWLGLTAEDVVERTGGVINLKLLSQLENNRYDLTDLRLSKYKALLEVLQWTPAEFEEATGVPRLVSDPLPGTEDYIPELLIPIVGTVSAGILGVEEYVEPEGHISIDPRLAPQLAAIPPGKIVALRVNGDSMVSDTAARQIAPGSYVVIELGAIPRDRSLVAAWLPRREMIVLKEYREDSTAVLRSYNPGGPVFRIGDEEIEVRGVVRMIQTFPPQ
ncbi:MAG TPA: LexA family transcriptional regulator [Trueperaceae bacterium]